MSVSENIPRVQSVSVGGAVYQFDFEIWSSSDLVVYSDDALQVLDVDYTVSFAVGDDAGGEITYLVAPTAGVLVTILRASPKSHPTNFPATGNFSIVALNNKIDKLTLQIQDLKEEVDRAAKQAPYSQVTGRTMPEAEAGKALSWVAGELANVALEGIVGDIGIHAAIPYAHESTSAPDSDRIILRDANGRAQVKAPSDVSDIAILSTVTDHSSLPYAHEADAAPTADRIILRDGSGRAQVAAPNASADIARLDTVTSPRQGVGGIYTSQVEVTAAPRTPTLENGPAGWTIASASIGLFVITHNLDTAVGPTIIIDAGNPLTEVRGFVLTRTTNSFTLNILDKVGLVDEDFSFLVHFASS